MDEIQDDTNQPANGGKTYRTTLYKHADSVGEGSVFVTATGGIGMEYNGRIVVKRLEHWVAMAYGDKGLY